MGTQPYPHYTAGVSVAGVLLVIIVLYGIVMCVTKIRKRMVHNQIKESLRKRRDYNDKFREEHGYSWDYVMIFKVYRDSKEISVEQKLFSMQKIITLLGEGGLETRLYYSFSHQEIICKIRAPLERLKAEAGRVRYVLKCDPVELRSICEKGKPDTWAGLKIPDQSDDTELAPYDFMFCRYAYDASINDTRADLKNLYQLYPNLVYRSNQTTKDDDDGDGDDDNYNDNEANSLEEARSTEQDGGIVRDGQRYFGRLKALNYSQLSREKSLKSEGRRKSNSTFEMVEIYQSTDLDDMEGKNRVGDDDDNNEAERSGKNNGKLKETRDDKFEEPEVEYSIFRGVDRLRLIYSIITTPDTVCCRLNVDSLLLNGCIVDFFPLHDHLELKFIEERIMRPFSNKCCRCTIADRDNDKIKDYYGEQVGIYFEFSNFLTGSLLPVALLGLATWIHILVYKNDTEVVSVPVLAAIMAMWSALFIEYWKRREATIMLRWGTDQYNEAEQVRATFTGSYEVSPITGLNSYGLSTWDKFRLVTFSYTLVALASCCILVIVGSIFIFRIYLRQYTLYGYNISSIASTIMIAIQIEVCGLLFMKFLTTLVDFENHRTDADYESSYSSKMFVFQIFNSFSALFYVAFVKPFSIYESCTSGGCMMELQYTLGTLILFRLSISNILEILLPLVKYLCVSYKREKFVEKAKTKMQKKYDSKVSSEQRFETVSTEELKAEKLHTQSDLSDSERAFLLIKYKSIDMLNDYNETMILFGLITMFISAFPLAATIGFFSLYTEAKVDFWKLSHLMKRPIPKSCRGIGVWLVNLEIISFIAVFTNAGMITYSGSKFVNYSWFSRAWVFLGISFGLILIRIVIAFGMPDMPLWVDIQLKRKQFIETKVIYNVEDETDDVLLSDLLVPPVYSIGKGSGEYE